MGPSKFRTGFEPTNFVLKEDVHFTHSVTPALMTIVGIFCTICTVT